MPVAWFGLVVAAVSDATIEDAVVRDWLEWKRVAERIVSNDYQASWNDRDVLTVTQTLVLLETLRQLRSE